MSGLKLIEPIDLYNLLNQEAIYPSLSDPVYLLLLDARSEDSYYESHILAAKLAKQDENKAFVAPFDADLECKTHVVVYDSETSSLVDDSPALLCAMKMWELGSRNPVEILNGGYKQFSSIYPFLRTQKVIYMPQELDSIKTYPAEIIQSLFLGKWQHANALSIQKELKIKGRISCCEEPDEYCADEEGPACLHIAGADVPECDLLGRFEETHAFINNLRLSGHAVLVYSKLGISRAATIVIAYLMKENNLTLRDAYNWVVGCRPNICPNRGFMTQLKQWEVTLNLNIAGVSDSVSNIY